MARAKVTGTPGFAGITRTRARARASKPSNSARGGRPTVRTAELASAICVLLTDGKSLRTICSIDGMPNMQTVLRWLADDADFRAKYAKAREVQADTLADDCIDIVDREDLKPEDKRVRFDARRWYASKLQPRKYGDKLEMNVTTDFAQRLVKARERAFAARKDARPPRKP